MGRRRGLPLTREDVIEAALALLSSPDAEPLGINSLAQALGIRPPSLYHHVASNEDLIRRVAIEGWRRFEGVLRAPFDAPDALVATLARRFRSFALAHPGLYRLMSETRIAQEDPEFQPVTTAIMGEFSRILTPIGLQGDDVIHAVRLLRASLHGFIMLEQSGQFGMPQAIDESFEWLIVQLDRMLIAQESFASVQRV